VAIHETICVLGAAGGLGSACVRAAVAAGHNTRALLRTARPGLFPETAQTVLCDANDPDSLARAAEGCSALLYCVNAPLARWHTDLPRMLHSAREACRATGARLVFPGNVWSYGPRAPGELIDERRPLTPTSRKGHVRAGLEQQLAQGDIDYVVARLPEFYGPNVANPLMGGPFRAALAGRTILWLGGPLDVTVEYIFIEDAAHALLELALADTAAVSGSTFHVPGVAHTTPRAFFRLVQASAHNRKGVVSLPALALRAAALVSAPARELLDIQHLWTHPVLLDGTAYRSSFGAVPATRYEQGIARTLEWFRAHPGAVNSN
jgi:nucleoside-diphosphate-sugar epimerase